MYRLLRKRIINQDVKICIVGLGYVGLPLAYAFAKKGFFVYGFDTNPSRINKLRRGIKYIVDISPQEMVSLIKDGRFYPTSEEKVLKEADVIIICVPTPLRKVKIPDVSYIIAAARTIKKHLRKGHLIILESTSYPTTTRQIVLPILKKTGLNEESDFFLCFSPERINPGDKKFSLSQIPKIVGGISQKSSRLAKSLYSFIIKKVHIVSSPEVAETTKLLENTFRLVNIALANEFAMVCHRLGISIWEVVGGAKTKPFGFMAFYPGPGVGGHCIPADPIYLSWKAKRLGFKTKMIDLASYINHFMPFYVVERVSELLKRQNKEIEKAKILILGVAYKKDVKDLRESPALDIIDILQSRKIKVDYFDPFIFYLNIKNINLKRISLTKANLRKYDCVILVTDHSDVDYKFIQRNSQFIFDTRNVYKGKFDNVEVL